MKKVQLTLEDIFDIPGAEIFNPDNFKSVDLVSIDSRNIKGSTLFIAIKGKRLDGHDFIQNAISNGAKAIVINKNRKKAYENTNIPFITVKDTTIALGDIAKKWREKLQAKIIGITGSAGKTSTKEMLASILSEKFNVNKTVANNNNHIGVPLTILSTNNLHDVLVAELGTNHFGEINYTANIAQPDYALITNIGDSHLEFLKNRRGVLKEKLALFEATAKRGGTLFINNDDTLLKNSLKTYSNKVSFSLSAPGKKNTRANVTGIIKNYTNEGHAVVELRHKDQKLTQELPVLGEQSAKNLVASAAVAFSLGLTKEEVSSGIKKITPADKRLNIKKTRRMYIIDDTYNANPESMKAAIELLEKINIYKRKIAILGDMFELGKEAEKKHLALVKPLKKNKINEVYTVGKFSKNITAHLQNTKIVSRHFSGRKSFAKFLQKYDLSDSVILVKGSRGMKMEELIKIIMNKEQNTLILNNGEN